MANFYPDIMVDVETTGLGSDNNAMIQLSAVKFDLRTQDVSLEFFDRCLIIPPWRYWDDSTWEWWRNDANKREVLSNHIYPRMEDPKKVMEDFVEWVGHGRPRFWSKPLSFDYQFVSSYCRDYRLPMPFKYWEAMDMRSFMRGISCPEPMVEPEVEFKGQEHNALHDILHQLRILFTFMDRNGKGKVTDVGL